MSSRTCGVPDVTCSWRTWEKRTELKKTRGCYSSVWLWGASESRNESCLPTHPPAPAHKRLGCSDMDQGPLHPAEPLAGASSESPTFLRSWHKRRGFIIPSVLFLRALERHRSRFTGHFDHSPQLLYVGMLKRRPSSWGPPGGSREHRKQHEGPSSHFSKHGPLPVPGWPQGRHIPTTARR